MKYEFAVSIVALFTSFCFVSAEEFSEVPAMIEELKDAINLNVSKYSIEFDEVGTIALEIEGPHNANTYKLTAPSKSATLTLYFEKGPNSFGSAIEGWDTLHFWIRNEHSSSYSYLIFKGADARVTKAGFADGVFQVAAWPSEDQPNDFEYKLRVSSNK